MLKIFMRKDLKIFLFVAIFFILLKGYIFFKISSSPQQTSQHQNTWHTWHTSILYQFGILAYPAVHTQSFHFEPGH